MLYKFIPYIAALLFNVAMFFTLLKISSFWNGVPVFTKGNPLEKDFFITAFLHYPIWAAVQQALILGVYYLARMILPVQYAIIFTAFAFTFFHYPNLLLMFAVGMMEMILLTLFSISLGFWFYFAMVFTHALLASCLLKFFNADVTHGFRVLCDWFKSPEK